jgi:copper(I)-binding protein
MHPMNKPLGFPFRSLAALLVLAGTATAAMAQTTVRDAWVRSTVPQQKITGAFMAIESARGGRLVGSSSPAAASVEIHQMLLEGNVMRMRPVRALELPAGKPVELKPGGYHLMLLDLKAPLKVGDAVPLTLVVEGKDGQRESVEVSAPVRNAAEPHGAHGGH